MVPLHALFASSLKNKAAYKSLNLSDSRISFSILIRERKLSRRCPILLQTFFFSFLKNIVLHCSLMLSWINKCEVGCEHLGSFGCTYFYSAGKKHFLLCACIL